ncbi:DUF2470 domain-containing protein [Breoghania sp. L-A4]|uniref:HugZ family pyridoxamine 5'-phosphate oxidase n=1 Tax=Breoghania sp. L-A4 TaxID=2304600 RepID=UPI0020C07D1B|nr:DUF2470 domain-containing protein [Breoghania sp. L-A4]
MAADHGAPFASLVVVACDTDGTPLLLLSDLAVHTRNIQAEPRASLLLCAQDIADPMQDARVSINGALAACADERIRRRFLARHPEAEGYSGFKDFSFYRLEVRDAHLVAGFGRIHTVAASGLLLDLAGAEALMAAEPGIVEHMNDDHADALALYATKLLGAPDGNWRITGCDPEGIDLVGEAGVRRMVFDEPANDAQAVRLRLVALAKRARERGIQRKTL